MRFKRGSCTNSSCMSGFPGGTDGFTTWAGCRDPCLQILAVGAERTIPFLSLLFAWLLVCVRRGEVLEGGEEIKDYTDQLPSSKDMHVFSQHQVVVKCYSHSWLLIKLSNLIDICSVPVEFFLESIWILGFGPQFKHSSLWHDSCVSVILHKPQCTRLWLNIFDY